MADSNKAVLEQANACVANGDNEGFLRFCSEDTTWVFVGDRRLEGKAAVRQYMAETYVHPPVFDVANMIADGDFVAAYGEITLTDANGRATRSSYCDVWRFRGGLMVELRAFVVEAKS